LLHFLAQRFTHFSLGFVIGRGHRWERSGQNGDGAEGDEKILGLHECFLT
jgi:hypothetical protein